MKRHDKRHKPTPEQLLKAREASAAYLADPLNKLQWARRISKSKLKRGKK